jgi:hypothetical protein
MILLLLLFGELVLLYILSGTLTQGVYELTVLLSGSRTMGITVISLFTFPGTVIHELAHLFTAEILGVRTGKLTLVPEGLDTEEIQAGSVMISHTDPFRRYLIGLAPLFAGMVAISAIAYLMTLPTPYTLLPIFYFYLLFAVSNAMFSSKEDLSGFIPFALVLGILLTAAYIAGLRIGLTDTMLDIVTRILSGLTKNLGIVLALHIGGLFIITLVKRGAEKITRKKIIRR